MERKYIYKYINIYIHTHTHIYTYTLEASGLKQENVLNMVL